MDHLEAERLLRERGCTLTPQRQAVLRFLDGNPDHPTASEILAAVTRDFPPRGGPITSRATVYNTLALLEEVGAVRVERCEEGEARFDPNVEPHHHLRCDACGRLEDVPAQRVTLLLDGAPAPGRVTLAGRCSRCR